MSKPLTVEPEDQPSTETDSPSGHYLTCNADLEKAGKLRDQYEYNTPEALADNGARKRKELAKKGALPEITVEGRKAKNIGSAAIKLNSSGLTEQGLVVECVITCVDEYMCHQHGKTFDCVPVEVLFRKEEQQKNSFQVVCLAPTVEQNTWDVTLTFTLTQLAKLIGVPAPVAGAEASTVDKIRTLVPDFAIKAYWFAAQGKVGDPNRQNHASGGFELKGGSGVVRLAPLTDEALKKSEVVYNSEWTAGEILNSTRPVLRKFGTLLKPDMMATNLEAESEYMLSSEEELKEVSRKILAIADESNAEFRKAQGIASLSSKEKKTTDTYYDFFTGKPPKSVLLQNGIVLRRRSVTTDDPGLFLLAAKGRTLASVNVRGERARYAGQAVLDEKAAADPEQLRAFVLSDQVDNVVSRVVRDALGLAKVKPEDLAEVALVPALIIESTRRQIVVKLTNQLQLDLSIDKAIGWLPGREKETTTLYTFEFGVGHPGVGGLVTQGSLAALRETVAPSEVRNQELAVKHVTRPYHVPADLHERLFAKTDHRDFRAARDAILSTVLKLKAGDLKPGGNKAQQMAKTFGLY